MFKVAVSALFCDLVQFIFIARHQFLCFIKPDTVQILGKCRPKFLSDEPAQLRPVHPYFIGNELKGYIFEIIISYIKNDSGNRVIIRNELP